MNNQAIELAVLDMAGTTLRDAGEVEACFAQSIREEGLNISDDWIKSVQGWSKHTVFQEMWRILIGAEHPEYHERVEHSYAGFKKILEAYYRSQPIQPTEGCQETFAWLREQGIKIALTTGFYREVADLILHRLGWLQGLDDNYRAQGAASTIDLSLTSDMVPEGRPAPDMIFLAMQTFGIEDPQRVVKVGDTPSDLEAGLRANCRYSIGLTNGTHTRAQLTLHPHTALLDHLGQLPAYLMQILSPVS